MRRIWFDTSGLFRAKQGEAEKIDMVDTYILSSCTPVENKVHVCPIDGAQLSRFTDPNFPKDIFVERCPTCNGFWLNRGEFTKFQHAREALLTQTEPTEEDKKLQAQIQTILADDQNGDTESVLTKLNAFLSQPVGTSSNASYLDGDENQSNGETRRGIYEYCGDTAEAVCFKIIIVSPAYASSTVKGITASIAAASQKSITSRSIPMHCLCIPAYIFTAFRAFSGIGAIRCCHRLICSISSRNAAAVPAD